MTKPLALLLYEHLLPGSQLVNRLRDLGYRVQNVNVASQLVSQAQQDKPLVVMADLTAHGDEVCNALRALRANPETAHIPVIAFSDPKNQELHMAARAAGATLVAASDGILEQLPALLDQALQVD